jgi:hypothetical protein
MSSANGETAKSWVAQTSLPQQTPNQANWRTIWASEPTGKVTKRAANQLDPIGRLSTRFLWGTCHPVETSRDETLLKLIKVCPSSTQWFSSLDPTSQTIAIWVNYYISLTWRVGPFGDDFPYKNHGSSEGEQCGRYNLPRSITREIWKNMLKSIYHMRKHWKSRRKPSINGKLIGNT